jgi:TatD DNase family protein
MSKSEIKYIDIHSHLDFPNFKEDLESVIDRMNKEGVGTITIGVSEETSREAVSLANRYDNVWACIGLHPDDSNSEEFNKELFESLVQDPKVVAVGECGLDYFRLKEGDEDKKELQKKIFIDHINFAVRHNKPLMLHVRPSKGSFDAHLDVLEILKRKKLEFGEMLRGNSHFFTSSLDIAKEYINLGFSVSFTGLITYVRDFDEVIKSVPIEMVHIETDSPFVPPLPFKGGRNEPSYVISVFKKLAEIRCLDESDLRSKLLENSSKLFNLGLL